MVKSLVIASSALHFAFCSFDACAATIDQVIVRQQWPWSTDVKVEYRIVGVTDPVNISVAAFDGDNPLDAANLAPAMKGDLFGIVEDGFYSFVIDPVAAFGNAGLAIMNFNVSLTTTPSTANMSDVLYKVVDLDTGAVTDITRADFYGNKYGSFTTNFSDFKANGKPMTTYFEDVLIWTEVTNNPIYKTDKLVLRKIPAASWGPWLMDAPGSGGASQSGFADNNSNAVHLVQLTSDYYAGVFPVTQAQYKKVKDSYGYGYVEEETFPDHQYKPVTGISWGHARGNGDHSKNPPSENSFCGILNAKPGVLAAGIKFDLPTEAQWEFAARGGVTNNALYYIDADVSNKKDCYAISWSSSNITDAYSEAQTVAVGRLPPNGFGLYEILGNAFEWVCDCTDDKPHRSNSTSEPEIDPMGVSYDDNSVATTSNGRKRILRGGSHDKGYSYSSLRTRYSKGQNAAEATTTGFRVICTVP